MEILKIWSIFEITFDTPSLMEALVHFSSVCLINFLGLLLQGSWGVRGEEWLLYYSADRAFCVCDKWGGALFIYKWELDQHSKDKGQKRTIDIRLSFFHKIDLLSPLSFFYDSFNAPCSRPRKLIWPLRDTRYLKNPQISLKNVNFSWASF